MTAKNKDFWIRTGVKLGGMALLGIVALNVVRLPANEAHGLPSGPPIQPILVSPERLGQPAPATAPAPKPAVTTAPQASAPMTIKRVLTIDGPFRHGDYVWDDAGVPQGPVVITVDLAAQTLSIFRAGYEIGAAVILYGADDMPTPLGTFAITQKDKDHVSNLYHAPMPYMLRLTNDGVSIHGTKSIRPDEATHGCVGVPVAFAAKLFAQVKLGDRVIVTRGKMMDLKAPLPAS